MDFWLVSEKYNHYPKVKEKLTGKKNTIKKNSSTLNDVKPTNDARASKIKKPSCLNRAKVREKPTHNVTVSPEPSMLPEIVVEC